MEHAEPELERTARRLRRMVLAIRIVFYSGAVLAVLVLLPLALPGGVAQSDETWLEGTTSQGMPFQLRIDPDGQPGRLMTDFTATCPAGALTLRWWPYTLPRLEDGALTIHETSTHRYAGYPTGYRTVTFRARVEGGSIHGTMKAREQFHDPTYGTYECTSGLVTFLARAG